MSFPNSRKTMPKHLLPFLLLFRHLADDEVKETFLNYLIQKYEDLKTRRGIIIATVFCLIQIFQMYISLFMENASWGCMMFKNYLKIGIRNFLKFKSFTVINIFGLSIGIACTLLIVLFIKNELSYDRFHHRLDSIYRLSSNWHRPDGSVSFRYGSVPIPLGPVLNEYFEDIKYVVRIFPREFTVKIGASLENLDITLTDESFFDSFTFPVLDGNPSYVLSSKNSAVLTETLARKYFGNEDPLGKRLTVFLGEYRKDFIVTGVAEDPPDNSSIQFSLLINIDCLGAFGREDLLSDWDMTSPEWQTFIEVRDKDSTARITNGLPHFTKLHISDQSQSFTLQRMEDIHFDQQDTGTPDLTEIYILSGIALFILLTAIINFITISVGNSSYRFMEIGIRKVHGASVSDLVGLLTRESIKWVILANVLAWPAAWYALHKWLQNYAYKISISPVLFIIGACSMLSVVLLTTSVLTIKAATADPVDSLRYE